MLLCSVARREYFVIAHQGESIPCFALLDPFNSLLATELADINRFPPASTSLAVCTRHTPEDLTL